MFLSGSKQALSYVTIVSLKYTAEKVKSCEISKKLISRRNISWLLSGHDLLPDTGLHEYSCSSLNVKVFTKSVICGISNYNVT